MAEYQEAFEEGIQAAKKASAAKKEIEEVFVELNRELRDVTENKVEIRRETRTRKPLWELAVTYAIRQALGPVDKYVALVAVNPSDEGIPKKELAEWKQGRFGYPCRIISEDREVSCENREALEQALADLLREPSVGEKLFALLSEEA